ncbi:expressed unknown protein [Seminavis robusta]|uniref:Uncharacterized protein n=1 Tax=Seminavis robusta TaxID=568900 RepID=A0A9N8DTJ1_9STRA|nr:expressed unknown protein [Seminavis robusta]|eukprot:Sro266_g103290.1 n/a (583) ;mRNA; r:68388-70136
MTSSSSPLGFRNAMFGVVAVVMMLSTILQFNRSVMILLVSSDTSTTVISTTPTTTSTTSTSSGNNGTAVSVVINNNNSEKDKDAVTTASSRKRGRRTMKNPENKKPPVTKPPKKESQEEVATATTTTTEVTPTSSLVPTEPTTTAITVTTNEANNWTVDFQVESFDLNATIAQVMDRWELGNSSSILHTLLADVYGHENEYQPDKDVIVFFHPLKSGGTSVSNVLEKSIGGVVPGSHESGSFNFKGWQERYYKDSQKHKRETSQDLSRQEWFHRHKVIFSHSGYRRVNQQLSDAAGMYRYTKSNLPLKRVQQVTMLRDPMSLVASNFNEWMCKGAKWAKKAQLYGIPQTNATNACDGYSLNELTLARIESNKRECSGRTEAQLKQKKPHRRRICKAFQAGQLDDSPHCASIHAFLAGGKEGTENILTNLHHYPKNSNPRMSVEQHVHNAVRYLGGIDAVETDAQGESPPYGGDMMWFGITERMKESMCLLHYKLNVPWHELPTRRMQSCRPVTYWTDDDKAFFNQTNRLARVLHQAANAVLDMQLTKARHEIVQKKQRGVVLPDGIEECMAPKLPTKETDKK